MGLVPEGYNIGKEGKLRDNVFHELSLESFGLGLHSVSVHLFFLDINMEGRQKVKS